MLISAQCTRVVPHWTLGVRSKNSLSGYVNRPSVEAQCERTIHLRNLRISIIRICNWTVFQGQMIEMQQEMIRQQQQHDPKDAASSGGATMDLGSSSQVVASAVAALDGGPRFGLVLPTVVSGENKSGLGSFTLDPANNEQFGYNERPAVTSRFLGIKIIDKNVERFSYDRSVIKKNILLLLLLRIIIIYSLSVHLIMSMLFVFFQCLLVTFNPLTLSVPPCNIYSINPFSASS